MTINNGYIKLHRSFKDWYGIGNPARVSMWVNILLLANHSPKRWLFKGKPYNVDKGQFITSRKSLSAMTGVSESRVEAILKEFIEEGQIKQQTTNVNRMITVTNYSQYQETGQQRTQQKGQQRDNKETTKRQQRDTNKNDKNDKNDKKYIVNKFPTLIEVKNYCKERNSCIDPNTFFDYYESCGWIKSNNQKIKDWKATLRTWENRDKKETKSSKTTKGRNLSKYMKEHPDEF